MAKRRRARNQSADSTAIAALSATNPSAHAGTASRCAIGFASKPNANSRCIQYTNSDVRPRDSSGPRSGARGRTSAIARPPKASAAPDAVRHAHRLREERPARDQRVHRAKRLARREREHARRMRPSASAARSDARAAALHRARSGCQLRTR